MYVCNYVCMCMYVYVCIIYTYTFIATPQRYLGCWIDAWDRDLNGEQIDSNTNSVTSCVFNCKAKGIWFICLHKLKLQVAWAGPHSNMSFVQ